MKFENNGNGHLYIELINENYDFKLEDAEAISQCMVTCNLTKGYSVSNIEEDIIPDMLNKVVRIDHNPGLTKRESQYYATGHSKPKCKGAINWSMEMNVDNQCHNTGLPGGDSGKMWNNLECCLLQISTWRHHDCRKGKKEYFNMGSRTKVCTKSGLLSYR